MPEALKTNTTVEEIHVGNLVVGCTVRLKSSGEEKVVTEPYSNGDVKVEGSDKSYSMAMPSAKPAEKRSWRP